MTKPIQEHPLYLQLSDKQRRFVLKYVETQDKLQAIKYAEYDCRDSRTSEMMANKNFKHPVIKQLLAEALGYAPSGGILNKKETIVMVSECARKTRNNALKAKWVTMLMVLKGWIEPEPDLHQKVNSQLRRLEVQRAKGK